MSYPVSVVYKKDGAVDLVFSEENRQVNAKTNECYFELTEEDKRYLIHLLNYKPKN